MKRRNREDEQRAREAEPEVSSTAPATLPVFADDPSRPKLGQVLVDQRLLTPEALSTALDLQAASGRRLGSVLVESGLVGAHVLNEALAAQFGVPTVDLRRAAPSDEVLALVPEATARARRIMPLRLDGDVLEVAIADPGDTEVKAALAAIPVASVKVFLAPQGDIEVALNSFYRLLAADDEAVQQFWAASAPVQVNESMLDGDAPVIQLVNRIVVQALRDRASDVHIEPTDGRVRIRFRVDGALHEVLSLPLSTGLELVSRIKVMAMMDIVERRRPQDGQFQTVIDGVGVDVRVATASTIWGETAVLRLLDKTRSMKRLADLGMPPGSYDRYLEILKTPYGMLLCSGPTGSGKTTTLYASLAQISRDELNVMTIEDPVEYVFPNANQMQILHQADITFASGLKSILRQDPDIILVGEIRDEETARIAVQSALTGHFVMSSIHATDACSALFRLVDMGIEGFLVASSLVGVVGQRLVRRICPSCAEPYELTQHEIDWYQRLGGSGSKKVFMRGAGCQFCSNTGFRERVGVYEVLAVTEEVSHALVAGATPHEVRKIAIDLGMRTMGFEGMQLVERDITTIDEVVRNVHVH